MKGGTFLNFFPQEVNISEERLTSVMKILLNHSNAIVTLITWKSMVLLIKYARSQHGSRGMKNKK